MQNKPPDKKISAENLTQAIFKKREDVLSPDPVNEHRIWSNGKNFEFDDWYRIVNSIQLNSNVPNDINITNIAVTSFA